MKHILFSTSIILGTFGGINAAALDHKSAQHAETLGAIGYIEQDTSANDYLTRIQSTFRNLDQQDQPLDYERLNIIHTSMLETNPISELTRFNTTEREKSAEKIILRYLEEVIDYTPFSWRRFASGQNLTILGALTGAHTLLITAGTVYPALAPLTGGVTLATINLVSTTASLYIKDYGWPKAIICSTYCQKDPQTSIQATWKTRLSNPELKIYFAQLLSYILVSQNLDISPTTIYKKLDELFLNSNNFDKIFKALFPEYTPEANV